MSHPVYTSAFFHETAKPTAEEFLVNTASIRLGRLAAIVLYRVADYWFEEHKKGDQQLRNVHLEIITMCPDFLTVRDVADASKHAVLKTRKTLPRTVTTSRQVQLSEEGLFHAPFGESFFAEGLGVIVKRDDGTEVSLAIAVQQVLAYWCGRV